MLCGLNGASKNAGVENLRYEQNCKGEKCRNRQRGWKNGSKQYGTSTRDFIDKVSHVSNNPSVSIYILFSPLGMLAELAICFACVDFFIFFWSQSIS